MIISVLCRDVEVARQAVGALANLAEDVETHKYIAENGGGRAMIGLMRHNYLDIYREASRTIANLLTSFQHQVLIARLSLHLSYLPIVISTSSHYSPLRFF